MRRISGPAQKTCVRRRASMNCMKPSERVNRFVTSRRGARIAKGEEVAHPHNVSSFIRDEEVAAYISKLLEIIDEQHDRITKLERQPMLVSYPRSTLAKPPATEKKAG